MLVDVTVKLKRGVTDPEGENTRKALVLLGFRNVRSVGVMKTFRIEVDCDDEAEAIRQAEEMCKRLLANPVIHEYEIKVVRG
ncbi:MAG: phosphoribosylformylglycinamidine synthase subunit PurS [Candidatus Alkanophagales archaeon]